jgi:hypothetical protein
VFNHEPENDKDSGNAAQFKAAFNHVRHVFDNVGAHNLRWVCTLMRPTYQGAKGGAGAWIPSGAQAIGVDGYNRGACHAGNGWESFPSLFSAARNYAKNHHKKLIVQEWGCVEPTACGGHFSATKAGWIRQACDRIRAWPEVETVIYSHVRANFDGNNFNLRVDSSAGALSAYRDEGRRTYFH